jgi:catechol 2,3-dioxygenase-like lactoylglutathione lyase family enzyme
MVTVLYAKDLSRVVRFYQHVLGLAPIEADPGFVVLADGPTEVTVVRVPPEIAQRIDVASPPEPRTDTPIKPVFVVSSLEAVRPVIAAHGGTLAPADQAWAWRGLRRLDGVDPEGNVVQFCEPLDR